MSTLPIILQSSRFNLYSGALLAVFFGIFAYAHFLIFLDTGKLSLLLVIISEALTTAFFIFRSNPKTVSVIPSDWLVAIIGSFAPLFLRPADYGVLPQAEILIVLGTILQTAGLISLNRSFAIVAAKREIKTEWMYRIIRHPLYASYFLIFGGYILVHTTAMNLVLFLITMSFLCLRIFREERHLSLDPEYRSYMLKVRYRIIPYIF
ncbi:MAG: isoprenylcysteine carboxylmethyltransferase family protein [Nitrosomonas sp.]|nr:isoprenylcysteine carboxylmethyltransferase family protein [Nitrosomonas sp.]